MIKEELKEKRLASIDLWHGLWKEETYETWYSESVKRSNDYIASIVDAYSTLLWILVRNFCYEV